jgi:hypothetical protein
MNEHRFILEPYKGMNSRYHCPACKSNDKTFSLYVDTDTNQHINNSVGRCNRESNCGYHYTPKQYFQDNDITFEPKQERIRQAPLPKSKPSVIDYELFKQSLAGYEANKFVIFLKNLFDDEIANQLIAKYFIGSSKHWQGSTVFWQINPKGMIRTGKIMLYDANSGKRVKKPFNYITWAQCVLKLPNFEMNQCLFGEHLLTDKTKPVSIVESEKTAIIASVYLPQFLWLATGGLSNLNAEKFRVLVGRKVVLFPDVNGFDKWTDKAKELGERIPNTRFDVSDLLENIASEDERINGLDLADYLIKFDWREFRKETLPPSIEKREINAKSEKGENSEPPENIYIFSDLVQPQEDAINWFNGHLLASMNKIEICETLHF